MAISLSGTLGRICRPSLLGGGLHLPDFNPQVRNYAARKGTREKRLKKKLAFKLKKAAQERSKGIIPGNEKARRENLSVTKTSDLDRKELPTGINIYYQSLHKYKPYSISEAVQCLREDNHPSMGNNPCGKLNLFVEFNMVAAKQTRIMDPWKSSISLRHVFDQGTKRVVWVICDHESVGKALEGGADMAGDASLIKKIKEGDLVVNRVDRIICHLNYVEQVAAIRSKLKQLAPKISNGTLTNNCLEALHNFRYGVEYSVTRSIQDRTFGWTQLNMGTINMDLEKLEDNFASVLEHLHTHGPKRTGEFISWIWCSCPPSKLRYKIDVELYLEKMNSPYSKKAAIEAAKEAVAAEE